MKIIGMTLTWNGLDKLEKLRPGLLENIAGTGCEFEWRIKDNGSKDGTMDAISKWAEVKAIDTGHNRDSFAKGMNLLFASGEVGDDDWLLFLNNDVIFRDSVSLKKMIRLGNKVKAGVVGARMCFENTEQLQHAGVTFVERYGGLPHHFRHGQVSDEVSRMDRYFQAVTAACCFSRASAWKAVNGMDEGYHWAFEDIDYCLKVGKLKKNNIVYCGGTEIWHEESASLKKNPVNKVFMTPNISHFRKVWCRIVNDDQNYVENNKEGAI